MSSMYLWITANRERSMTLASVGGQKAQCTLLTSLRIITLVDTDTFQVIAGAS